MQNLSSTMTAVVPQGLGLRPRLGLADKPLPKLTPDDVLVKVHAASVNPKDWKLNASLAAITSPLPTRAMPPVFGDDLAGVVVAAGSRVTEFSVGDAVYGMDMYLRTASLAQYARIARGRIAKMPPGLSFGEAASMPLAALTALQGLVDKGGAGKGSQVLIIGASGGVGTFAVQIAHALECEVTAVCSARNAALVTALGADQVVDYTQVDIHQLPHQYDIVFDVTSFETPAKCRSLLKPGGRFVSTGGYPGAVMGVLLNRRVDAQFVWVRSNTQDLQTLARMVEQGQLKPIIDSRFPLADAQGAYDRSRSGRAREKIVIEVCEENQEIAGVARGC